MIDIDELKKQETEYEVLIGVLRDIPSLTNAQYDVVHSVIGTYGEKLNIIKRDIEKQETYQKTLNTRYRIIRSLLLAFSFFSIISLFLLQQTQSSILTMALICFLMFQYIALFFLEMRAKNKIFYILGLLLFLVPCVVVVIQSFYPNFLSNKVWLGYAFQVMSLYNFCMGLYDRLATKK